jgi:hypothetical protein
VFTPDSNFNGLASFDYTVSDGSLTDTGTVNITVNAVNDAPTTNNSSVVASQDGEVIISLYGNDIDGDALTYLIVTGTANGALGAVTGNQITYTPSIGYTGSDSFSYKVNDGVTDSEIATVTITVNPPPVISAENNSTPTESTTTITWTTDHPSTSRVVYDTVPHLILGSAPNYGYANSTVETDSTIKVTSHSVTISGLTAGTVYYYRVVSHGSPEVVGEEKSLTTKSTESNNNSGSSSSSSSSSNNSSVCSDQKPGSAPVITSITQNEPNKVTLTWSKAKDPVSYYLIAFGTKSGEMLYGNPFVGDQNTTSYTVNNLVAGTKYFFKVRAGNNCMPGDFSNESSIVVYGGYVNEIPDDFIAGVLGTNVSTPFIDTNNESKSDSAEIKDTLGTKSNKFMKENSKWRNSILASIGIMILLIGYYIQVKRKKY